MTFYILITFFICKKVSALQYTKRLKLEKTVLEAFWCWLDSVNALKGSSLGKTVTYAQNQKPYMQKWHKVFAKRNVQCAYIETTKLPLQPQLFNFMSSLKYSMKFFLFSNAVVVGLPRLSLAPIEHLTSIRLSSSLFFAVSNS